MKNSFNEIIKSIFERAVELDKLSRELFFKNLNSDEKEYEEEVKSLLDAYDGNNDFLEIDPGRDIFSEDNVGPHPLIGKHIGAYLIEEEIGVGGMGIVFSGKRDDNEFEQKVAIKILKQGLSSEYLVKQFQNERQTLANLQHPNIARLFDGGKTSEGLPFLIMEFIDGVPITEYCDKNNLTIEQRLKLLITVCNAVQYAHQNLIIHRDIKPGNILVNKEGQPKLLDFGVSKLLDQNINDESESRTKTEMWHLTPEYASPEQIKGGNITTSSDIYSLGVLLYQILTGSAPYKIYNASPLAISKIFDEEKISKPSEIVQKNTKEMDHELFHNSLTNFKKLKGDLDNIVLKAMHKDSTQRYISVQGLINDISRFLKGFPVSARKDTYTYRFTKFVQRHKVGVALFILFNIMVISSIIAIIYQAKIAAKERDKAKIEAAKTESVNNFLLEMLSSADPTEIGKDAKVYDVLKKASQEVNTGFKDYPGIEAAVRKTLGKTLTNLGEYEQAKLHLDKSLELNEKEYGEKSYQAGESLHELALLYDWMGNLKSADSLYVKSINILRNNTETPLRSLSSAINDYGIIKQQQDRYKESLVLLKEAYKIAYDNFGSRDRDVASLSNNLGLTYEALNELDSAQNYYQKSIELYLDLYGINRPEISTLYNNMAYIYIRKLDYEKAHEYFSKSLDLKIQTWGEKHSMVGLAYMNLGALEYMMKKFDTAENNLIQSIDNFKVSGNDDHVWVGLSSFWYAKILIERSKVNEAEKLLKKALKIYEKNYPEDHINIISANADLGVVFLIQKKYSQAENLLIEGYEKIKLVKGINDNNTLRLLEYIIKFYEETGNEEKSNYYKKLLSDTKK